VKKLPSYFCKLLVCVIENITYLKKSETDCQDEVAHPVEE
jgi:hypothetical protein